MPGTGLKIVGTGACLPWHSISSSIQNSLKMSGHRGYEFWCWNLVPFLSDKGFQLLKSLWLSLMYFSFNDAQHVLYSWKMWTAGRPIQHPDSSTTKTCCCNSCSMWLFPLSCWNTHHLERSICCFKPYIYIYIYTHTHTHLSAFTVPSKTCKLTIQYARMHPHTIRDAGFWTERWWHAGSPLSSLTRRTWRDFQQEWKI